jgi:hypothetical protein
MRPFIGAAAAVLQYLMFVGHPVLSLYPRLVDGALGGGAFAAVLLALNLAVAMRFPYTAAFSTATLYLAEAVLASPLLRTLLPLPELPAPDIWLGAAAVLLLVAASARGLHGAYLAATAAPAALVLYLKDAAPRLDATVAAVLLVAGAALLVYATRSSRG